MTNSKSKVPSITKGEWFREVFKEAVTEIPEGYFNANEIAKQMNRTPNFVRGVLREKFNKGEIDRISVREKGDTVYYYGPKKEEKK